MSLIADNIMQSCTSSCGSQSSVMAVVYWEEPSCLEVVGVVLDVASGPFKCESYSIYAIDMP